ncbi:hypothetical protein S40293_11322 [Stachybotrys chartarum IBT 40293]|nr:hypothetical protein S40293_11322 [Stachybotrys chartarum IBT 40293]
MAVLSDTVSGTYPAPTSNLASPAVGSNFLFTVTVKLSDYLGPIPVLQGGNRLVEATAEGKISGPGFYATIEGGIATPILIPENNSKGIKSCLAYI